MNLPKKRVVRRNQAMLDYIKELDNKDIEQKKFDRNMT